MMRSEQRKAAGQLGKVWWLFLITGIAWLLISMIVLRFDITSITAVGVLLGVVFLMAGLNEFFTMAMRPRWKWAHVLLGILFVAGGIWAFIHPFDAFWALASVLGFLLVFKGTLDLVGSVMSKSISELWWLGMVVGILEILLGFWASQQFYPARAALILIWVGFFALFRGIAEIVLAFEVRKLSRAAV